jgi:plastocyanin
MTSRITASLVVCVAAAGVAVGALALDSDDTAGTGAAGTPTTSPPTTTAPGGGGYGSSGGRDTGGTPAGSTLPIQGFAFGATSVAPGAQVTVENGDDAPHTVTATGGAFDADVDAGGTTSFTAPAEAGAYAFTCQIHPGMSGTLTVG